MGNHGNPVSEVHNQGTQEEGAVPANRNHLQSINGHYRYRRRWPKKVRAVAKGEYFIRHLGTASLEEALRLRPTAEIEFFSGVDKLIGLVETKPRDISPAEATMLVSRWFRGRAQQDAEYDLHNPETDPEKRINSLHGNLFEITELGTVLELERAWVAPTDASRERFQAACDALLKLAPKRALLLLKAYPLEYEGRVTAENAGAQARRQRALIRLYRQSMGAEPLPAPAGDEGWMYLIPERLRTELRQPTPTGY
jgi:hypothetical protein